MVTKELQENPALEEGVSEESETAEQARPEVKAVSSEPTVEPVFNRELSAVDKMGTMEFQEYLDTHSNAMHSSLTAEAMSEDGDGPPSWENSLTKKISLEDHLIWQLRLSKIAEREAAIGTITALAKEAGGSDVADNFVYLSDEQAAKVAKAGGPAALLNLLG